MKQIILVLSLLPSVLFAKVGPDLSSGADPSYFTKLRMDYSEHPKSEFYPVWKLDPDHKAVIDAYKEGDLDQILKLADTWLRKCPVDADTHLRVAMCYKEKGDLVSYTYHIAVFYGLLNSITSKGDGLTPETAFHVISIQEEYSLIQEIGGSLTKQSLVAGPCDKMEITRKNEEVKLTLYFNVSIPMKFMGAQMKKSKDKSKKAVEPSR